MRALLVSVLLLAAALAGCADGGDDDPKPSTTTSGSATGSKSATKTSSGSRTTSTSGTGTGAPTLGTANLTADDTNGTAPLAVNFTISATGSPSAWRLSFGDGSSTNGTTVPATVNHTYVVGGNFSANLTVAYGTLDATDSVNITVAVPAGGSGAPDVTHFEFGESLGCASDAHSLNPAVPLNCVSFHAGSDAPTVDGHWLALDERYWGLTLTTTMDEPSGTNHDSDCYFFAADETTEVGEASNGSEACTGVVPDGTFWLFLYPYAQPATAMTADFA